MGHFRTRRPTYKVGQHLQPLIRLRESAEYHDGGQEMAQYANMVAFKSEVARQTLSGGRRMPRRYQAHLYELTSRLVEQQVALTDPVDDPAVYYNSTEFFTTLEPSA